MAHKRDAQPVTQEDVDEAAQIDDAGRESKDADNAADDDSPPVDANEWAQAHADALADRRYLELVAQCELYRALQDSMEEIIADTKEASKEVKAEIDRLFEELNPPKRMTGKGWTSTRSVSTTKKIDPVKLVTIAGLTIPVIKACTDIKKKNVVTIRKAGAAGDEDGEE